MIVGGLLGLAGVIVGWCIGEEINARRFARLWKAVGRLPTIACTDAPTTAELSCHEVVTDPPPDATWYEVDGSDLEKHSGPPV